MLQSLTSTIVIDAQAWNEGHLAARSGADIADNPYDTNPERLTSRALSWGLGYMGFTDLPADGILRLGSRQ